jgi:hypothetical protein
MKINRNFLSGFSAWVALSIISILFFQNCGQQGDIALKMEETASDTLVQDICAVNPLHVRCTNAQPTGKVEEYRYIDVSQPVIPDLKIFLVLDNSDSMRVSQVNLMNNIEKMFSANSQGLSEYNSEIFILTTAQLNNIGNSLFRSSVDSKNDYQKVIEKIYEISSVQYVQSMIEVFRPADGNVSARKTSGLLEGDMVGFKVRTTRAPSAVGVKYDLINAEFSPAYLTHIDQPSIVSVKYSKGESIQDLVAKVKARVEFLDPDRQYLSKSIAYNNATVDNVPLSDVVEKESGLCAMARVLHEVKNNPDNSLIKKGELATFILVSDEKEHDPSGLECVKSYKFQQPVPGFLYKGECADADSNVSYAIPSDKTVTFRVKKPYTRHILWGYESIQAEAAERIASCDVKFNQSLARLKVLKNTHVVTFNRKVVDSGGADVVDYWKHDLKFDRVNSKHNLNFTRTTLKHKVNFNRISQKYAVTGKRAHTAPIYAVDIKRKKVAKYQKVNYKRETILKKEGSQTVVVETYRPPSPIRVSNVNFSNISQCTQDWLRTVPAVSSLEKSLSASESYKYTVTECVINNDETLDNKVVEVVGVKPEAASCNEALAKGVYAEGTLAANESFSYLSIDCLDRNAAITLASLNIPKDGVLPSVASCTPEFASSIDTGKPSVDAGKGETLVYSEIACSDASTTQSNVEIANLSGSAPVTNILNYIKVQDGNKDNTSYSGYSATDTNVVEANQAILVVGAAPSNSTDIHNSIVAKDGNRDFTMYSAETASTANVTDINQSIVNIADKYDSSVNGALAAYIAAKDGNKANVSYANTSVTNKATYKISLAIGITVNGKTPSTCDIAYASSRDTGKPVLTMGQSIVYSNVSCSATTAATYQIVRSGGTVKYDGVYGHKAVTYEAGLGVVVGSSRACSAAELNAILAQESAASPALNIDGNVLIPDPTNHCRVYNSEVTWADANKTKILTAINSDTEVKNSANASQCETAMATYCSGNATNNPNGLLACENKPATYVSYRAYKPEYRKYSLKPPVKPAGTEEIHWFGFEPIVTKNKAGTVVSVNLLNLTCAEVPGACVGATASDNSVVVAEYFKQKYAAGSATDYAALGKVARSVNTVTDSVGLVACNGSFMADYSECRNKSVQYSNYLSYDDSISDIAIAKGIDTAASCDDVCTADSCKTKDASSFAVPYAGKTMNQFYNNACSIGSVATTGSSVRSTASVRLTIANSDSSKYQHDVDVCALTCAESGLCKLAANSEIDLSQSTVRQYIAMKNLNMDPAKVASCKMVRKASAQITGKSSFALVDNECVKPAGTVLPNKYVRNKLQYYDADPSPSNEVKLVRENEINLENYIKNSFDNVLGDGYVSMIAFANQNAVSGQVEGADYNRIAQSVGGQIRDVKAASSEYGDALKFLGEKVAAQLASSFKVVDIDTSQQITRVWYSSWFTKGKFVELSPTDYTASANSFVITNPDIVNRIKTEAAFKFFVEIY